MYVLIYLCGEVNKKGCQGGRVMSILTQRYVRGYQKSCHRKKKMQNSCQIALFNTKSATENFKPYFALFVNFSTQGVFMDYGIVASTSSFCIEAHAGLSRLLWRGFLMLMYSELLAKKLISES